MGRAVGVGVERATDVLVSPARPSPRPGWPLGRPLEVWARGLERLPGHEDAPLWHAGLRSGGEPLWAGSVGGALFDVGTFLLARLYPAQRWVRPALIAAAGTGGALLWAKRRMAARRAVIKRWPVDQRATVPAAVGIGGAVYAVGVGLTRGYAASRNGLIRHLGPGFGKNTLGRAGNAALVGRPTPAVQRRLHRTSQRTGRARLHRPADLNPGLGQPGPACLPSRTLGSRVAATSPM